ncbi:YcaO-like family protein [Rhizobium sp. ARZ01]|uniref:YcaO-like family protein n=1 Tax=Rhizobium sp. ARZ01 TaxID=2769313 RepID=UPI0017811538|nr:YcaO-like family protein [Rhizobium sp. ARZ01]MBD9373054.1 YcaO-like family protein [Rhizobium sp. ARZ01]
MHGSGHGFVGAAFDLVPVSPANFPVVLNVALPRVAAERPGVDIPHAATPEGGRIASGRGMTAEQARISCLGEAAELISSCRWGYEATLSASYAAVKDRAIHPASLLLASDAQYEARNEWNARHGSYDWLPRRFDEGVVVDWVGAIDPDGGEPVLVTAAQAYVGYADADDTDTFAIADSNGCAAGATLDDAAIAGFLELVERDATALWWYGRHVRPAADLEEAEGVDKIREWLADRGRSCHLLDLTTDFGIPVRAAISTDRAGGTVAIGTAAHFDPSRAAVASLTEMMQTLQSLDMRKAIPAASDDPFLFWLEAVNSCSMPHLLPAAGNKRGKGDKATVSSPSLDRCTALCRDRGLRLLMVDLTRPRVGVPVARVIVPGLRPQHTRFAAGRLFDLPPRLGWCNRPPTVAELNAVPMAI